MPQIYRNDYTGTDLFDVNGTDYLSNGDLDDPLTMFREVEDLLECEKDNVQKMYDENYEGTL